jgi:hypothetical protein
LLNFRAPLFSEENATEPDRKESQDRAGKDKSHQQLKHAFGDPSDCR